MLQASFLRSLVPTFFPSSTTSCTHNHKQHAFIRISTLPRLGLSIPGRRKKQTRPLPRLFYAFLVLHPHQAGPKRPSVQCHQDLDRFRTRSLSSGPCSHKESFRVSKKAAPEALKPFAILETRLDRRAGSISRRHAFNSRPTPDTSNYLALACRRVCSSSYPSASCFSWSTGHLSLSACSALCPSRDRIQSSLRSLEPA